MSQGLRVWNSSGVLTLDITDRITKRHGVYTATIGASATSVTVSVSGMSNDGSWFAVLRAPNDWEQVCVSVISGGFKVWQTWADGVSTTYTVEVYRC